MRDWGNEKTVENKAKRTPSESSITYMYMEQ
jgi:hypothetical protein